MMKFLYFLIVFATATAVQGGETTQKKDPLDVINSPYIKGDTLYIVGVIDSHIYDYFSYEAQKVQKVKKISLNSWGGSHDWALEIGRRIQEFKKDTVLEEGNVCASACVYLFGSGVNRFAHKSTWFGIHGARLGVGRITSFRGTCFINTEEGRQYLESLKGCRELVSELNEISTQATEKAFDLIEQAGVSGDLEKTYNEMEDDPHWSYRDNLHKKPDWELKAFDAMGYNLVTEIID